MAEEKSGIQDLKEELSHLQAKLQHLEDSKNETAKKDKPIRSLFRWQSFSRPYRKRTTRWFIYTILLVATIILILLFVNEFFIIAPVLALVFVAYALATVPPEIIENEITSQGINSSGHTFIWEELDDFWFTEKRGFISLNFDTYILSQRRLSILINVSDREKIRQIIAKYRPYRELPKTTWVENVSEYFSDAFHKLTG